jgi:predicted alpha-1,6-mannanase (GH76 family)
MRGKLLLVVGLGVGYVLGAKAGRQRYVQIKYFSDKIWNSRAVQRQVRTVGEYAKDKAPEVTDFLSDGAKKIANTVTGTAKNVKAKTTHGE